MKHQESERQIYVVQGHRQLHSFVLEPQGRPAAPPAVVLVNPLYYESTFASRCYYRLARVLRSQGLRVVSFNFEGYASSRPASAEPTLDGLLEQVEAALGLAHDLGSQQLGLFGVRSGGLLAYLAAARRQDLAALALWAPLHRPNAFARELRVKERLRRLQLNKGSDEPQEIRDDEPFDVNGYLASPALLADIAQVKLQALDPPSCPAYVAGFKVGTRKVPEVPAYAALFEGAGRPVTRDETTEERPWVFTERADPVIPAALLARSCNWIAETMGDVSPALPLGPLPSPQRASLLPEETGNGSRPLGQERAVATEFQGRLLHGVVHEPRSTVPRRRRGFLFLDTSNKLMVEMARTLALHGFPVLRADTGASSISFGEDSELPPDVDTLWSQVASLVDFAQTELQVDRVGLSGLCFFAMLTARVALLREGVVDRLILVGMPLFVEGLVDTLRRGQENRQPPAQAPSFSTTCHHNVLANLAAVREEVGERLRLAQDSSNPWVRLPAERFQSTWTRILRPWAEKIAQSARVAPTEQTEEQGEDQVAVHQSLLAYQGEALHLLSAAAHDTETILGGIRRLQDQGYRPTLGVLPGNASNSFNGIAEREAMVQHLLQWLLDLEGGEGGT